MNREDIPMLKNNLIYFDNGATTLKPKEVIDEIKNYYENYCANAHRGDYKISQIVDEKYEEVRNIIKNFINAKEKSEIAFTTGTTDGLNKIVFGYYKNKLKKDDEVLITESEHASGILPWFILSEEIGIKIKYIPLDEKNEITIDNLNKAITNKTKVISISHVTNVIGDIRPIKEIAELAHKNNIELLVDAAQSMSHVKIDVQDMDIDFLVSSAHKFYGPTGVGFMYGKYDLLDQIKPTEYGGGMNAMFLNDGYIELREIPTRLEAGTQNIAGIIGMGKAIEYLEKIGIDRITKHEHELKKYLVSEMKKLNNIEIYNEENEGSIVAFNVKGIFSQDTAIYLDKHNICIRSGNHCAKILNNVFNVNNTCRVSFGFYNTKEEIDEFIKVLKNINNIWEEIL